MKKKSFLSGLTTKLAIAAVALSSTLMTGCYKDEGLDTNAPGSGITIPTADAVYTLVGTVVDQDGNLVDDANVSVAGENVVLNGASFTVKIAKFDGETKKVSIRVEKSGYKTVEKDVTINKIPDGQAVTYTETIVLVKDVNLQAANYELSVKTVDAEDTATELNATVKVTNGKGDKQIADNNGIYTVEPGIYNVVATLEGYSAYSTTLTLPEVMGENPKPISVEVIAVLQKKDAPKEYRTLTGTVNLPEDYTLVSLSIIRGEDEVVATTTAPSIVYLAEKDGANYRMVVEYKDANGESYTAVRYFSETEIACYVYIPSNSVLNTISLNGEEHSAALDGETNIFIPAGTTATLPDGTPVSSFDLIRMLSVEASATEIMRAYQGTPDGLVFSNPIQISFEDKWGGELGDFHLEYLENGVWVKTEVGDGEVEYELIDGKYYYIMYVHHFSTFRAIVNYNAVVDKGTPDLLSTVTPVNKKNDTSAPITVYFQYNREEGMIINDVTAAIKKAGFSDNFAINIIKLLIDADLAEKGYVNQGINTVSDRKYFDLPAWTILNTIKKTQALEKLTVNYTVDGKEIAVSIYKAGEITIDATDYYTYGHGHGHAHGHGNDLNAGGGIMEAE